MVLLSAPPILRRPECFRHMLKPPFGTASGGEPLPVKFVCNLPGGVARRLQFSDAAQDTLFRRVRFPGTDAPGHASLCQSACVRALFLLTSGPETREG